MANLSSNVAMQLSKQLKRKPRDVAQDSSTRTADAGCGKAASRTDHDRRTGIPNVRLSPSLSFNP